MAGLSLKHIYKVYPNGTKAVNDFNMQINDKEFIVFVGPSGCGKSTMLRMIAGLEEITAGELRIGDAVVNDMEPKDRDIAMVFQNYALYPNMTIYDNIAFGLRMRKMPKEEIDKKVRDAAEVLGITDYLKRKPKEMSGGQRQRVALGRAIVREPKVMLLDEPLSNLDAKLRTQMRSEIVKLHNKLQTTFIYVTHDQVEAMTMGTRIVVMKDGFIQQIDTPKNLYQMPVNKFVAGFIGTPQMNFFDGTLKKDGDVVHIEFKNSEAKITVPYTMLMKATPEYFDGEKPVCIGLRADDITADPDEVKNSDTTIKVRISHTEELGTETLVYGDIDMSRDVFGESPTQIILKAAGFKNFSSGDIIDVALNLENVHLFDAETEQSILPRIPKYNNFDCTVKNNVLIISCVEVKLPKAAQCADGQYELSIPTDAIIKGGDMEAKVISVEDIEGQTLALLDIGGSKMFALFDEEVKDTVNISIDFKKIILRKQGEEIISPMPLVNGFNGNFTMEKVKAQVEEKGTVKTKKVAKYSIVIGGEKFEAPQDVALKMFAALSGRKVFNTQFRYELPPDGLAIADEGISAEVKTYLDYGRDKYIQCAVGEENIYVRCDKEYSGTVKLYPDLEKVSVIEKDRGIRIV